jgi:hypothetical protein
MARDCVNPCEADLDDSAAKHMFVLGLDSKGNYWSCRCKKLLNERTIQGEADHEILGRIDRRNSVDAAIRQHREHVAEVRKIQHESTGGGAEG